MLFTGKIKSIDLNETLGDTVTLGGPSRQTFHCARHGAGVGEIMAGLYALNRDEVEVKIRERGGK
jgi:hypothetical protein